MEATNNSLVLTQYRNGDKYNDFIGKYYHFPANSSKSYLSMFEHLPIDFVYYEPIKNGKGEFFGYGQIKSAPFKDKNNEGYCFVEIVNYKPFSQPVSYKDEEGNVIEQISNPDTYNASNAVRRVSSTFINNVCLDGHILLNFESDSHLVNILGEQLIGSEKVGILELVKNSIDAGASYCRVRFEKVSKLPAIAESTYLFPDLSGPVILIEDDGSGMTMETIEKGWLRPASTLKTDVKIKLRAERENAQKSGNLAAYTTIVDQLKKEHGGRIPLGEKGVGRFATNRLGHKLMIRTKTANSPDELVLRINWDDFDVEEGQAKDLNSIGVELTRQSPSRDYGIKGCGTQIIIYGGRENFEFDAEKIKDINKSIMRLNSPNPKPNMVAGGFHAYLECPQMPDLEQKEIYKDFIPNFSLEAIVEANGVIGDYTLKFIPPSSVPLPAEEWHNSADEIIDLRNYDLKFWHGSSSLRLPACGSFYIHLDAWYRAKPWLDGPEQKEMLEYLSDYGGISIYRDNVIIFPAESGTKFDWLNLSQRHIKQGYRISYYNLLGNIELEQTENLDLIDKTNREGMIENQAYRDLSKLVETLIQNVLEIKFISKRDEYTNLTKGITRDPKRLNNVTKVSSEIIDGISEHYEIETDPWHILSKLGNNVTERRAGLVNLSASIKTLKKSIELIDSLQEKLTEQAGFGLAAAVSIHELNKIASNFYIGISNLIEAGNPTQYQLEDLRSTSESLQSELKRLGPLRTIRNEKKREFKVSQAINYALAIFKSKFAQLDIHPDIEVDEDITIYARYSTLCQIIVNLIDNSLYWLQVKSDGEKKIVIKVSSTFRMITIGDSGPGIDSAIRPYLFEAGYSMKVPPSGLGLYICKVYMQAMKGSIYETPINNRIPDLSGAQFTIDLTHVPSKKEDDK